MDIKKELDNVLKTFSTLSYDSNKNTLEGELSISKGDSYDILIELECYPEFFPIVYETGERIPRTMKRHCYTDTGSCCLTTKAISQILLKTKIKSLSLFITEIVTPYFQNNSYYEINRKYKTDEYSHDALGIVEGYRDILKTKSDFLIAKLIYERVEGKKLTIRDLCYCGSGLPMKKCNNGSHDRCYRQFKMINKNVLTADLHNDFMKHLNKRGNKMISAQIIH